MTRRILGALAVAGLAIAPLPAQERRAGAEVQVSVRRVPQNPLVSIDSSPSLGGNVNGATVIRVPDWVEKPLGRYYMYFANHMGDFIRLAYADSPVGPWTVHEPGVLHVRDTAFFRPQPDPPETLENFYTHVASPEIYLDRERQQFILWTHGWYTNGERWPSEPKAAAAWASSHGYGQFTQAASSTDGLHFTVAPAITRTSYLRVFRRGNYYYGVSRLGRLSRSRDPFAAFELGPSIFDGGPYANKVRHVALMIDGDRLGVFFTAIGDAPEHVVYAAVDLAGEWTGWRAGPATGVLSPEAPFECPDLPNVASLGGDVEVPVRQIRDPFVFVDDGRRFLYYSYCGEQGIAAAEIGTWPR